jgi:hypothetical protein
MPSVSKHEVGWLKQSRVQKLSILSLYYGMSTLSTTSAAWVAVLGPDGLRLSALTRQTPPSAHAYELWGIAPQATRPVPLGVIPASGEMNLAALPRGVSTGATIAISIEPPGARRPACPRGPLCTLVSCERRKPCPRRVSRDRQEMHAEAQRHRVALRFARNGNSQAVNQESSTDQIHSAVRYPASAQTLRLCVKITGRRGPTTKALHQVLGTRCKRSRETSWP